MDTYCMNLAGVRYLCHSSNDGIDHITIGDNSIRVGTDLYNYARGDCSSLLKTCPLKERNEIQLAYQSLIQEDQLMFAFVDAMFYDGPAANEAAFAEFSECMRPLCGEGWADCFRVTDIDRRAHQCERAFSATKSPMAVRQRFYNEMIDSAREFCHASGGNIDYHSQKCEVTVVFGVPEIVGTKKERRMSGRMTKKLNERRFKVGEIVDCSQTGFDVNYAVNNKKGFGIIDMAKGQFRILAGTVLTIATVIPFCNKTCNAAGVSFIGAGVADTIQGAGKLADVTEEGACFIGGKLVAQLNTYFRLSLMR
jgi:hypothetical protein